MEMKGPDSVITEYGLPRLFPPRGRVAIRFSYNEQGPVLVIALLFVYCVCACTNAIEVILCAVALSPQTFLTKTKLNWVDWVEI